MATTGKKKMLLKLTFKYCQYVNVILLLQDA